MNNEKIDNLSLDNSFKIIIKGSLISFISLMVLLFVFAAILAYTSVEETIIPIVTIIINTVSILIGSSIATIHIKKNGIINGIIIGIIYMLVIYLISGILNSDFTLPLQSILLILFGIAAGGIGGILGVNIK